MTRPSRLDQRLRSPGVETAAAVLLVLVILMTGLGSAPIVNGDEARFAQAAREMLFGGDWIVPSFAGAPRYDKPILIYWAVAGSFRLFGTTPWAARLPSALAAALCIGLLAFAARRRRGPGAGWTAGILLAASPVFFVEARACTADALNLLWTLAAMLALRRLTEAGSHRAAAAVFWTATALAVLTKGPVAPMFIVSTLIALWALSRRWTTTQLIAGAILIVSGALGLGPVAAAVFLVAAIVAAFRSENLGEHVRAFHPSWGIPLFLAITLPWAVAAWRATGGRYFAVAVGRHVIERAGTGLEGHGGFPGFYLVTALLLCYPWIAPFLDAVSSRWAEFRRSPDTRFLLAWTLGPLITLEVLGTKLVHYWLPSYPAMILLLVGFLWAAGAAFRSRWTVTGLLAGGLLLAAVPLVPPFRFGLPGILALGVTATVVMATTTVAAAVAAGKRPRLALTIAGIGTMIFLSLLTGPYLGSLSRSFLGQRTVGIVRAAGWTPSPAFYRLRDEEILFSLPPDTTVLDTPEDVRRLLSADPGRVVCTRDRYLHRDLESLGIPFEILEKVRGIDLGRGRRDDTVCFRRREDQ